mmetsp:Transcript_14532/g.35425  ORF Transcript_14532/g.35425 Transcript_14532/m.35425 type:complete len:471 (+) Transcript_14532:510-1922(+)|eukprot:CAMPEP_0114512906 /NCGR_PEP_ID=MMETSP0109-20121206/15252_1 /TAXON_ID=29199 /ORGANISM="Chlorarachnion reptans, Strain CCCM449" /LENGTH=470 /DNA_ID=CAMNT_0001692675 /DNA_START=415 /DNA_END=1827 /DNA_ORIENTATION=+
MSISPFFSANSDNVESLAISSSLSSAHQTLNPSSPNISPALGSASGTLGLPSMGNDGASNFYHSPNDIFLEGGTVDAFKISSDGGHADSGMNDETLGSLFDFKRDQSSQPGAYISGTSPGTSTLFSQASMGARLLSEVEHSSSATRPRAGGLYMDLDAKPKSLLGLSSTKDKGLIISGGKLPEQEHTMLAKKVFDSSSADEPTIDAELAAVGIKGIPTIHTACVDGNLRLVKHLTMVRNADVEAKDILGSRPLHVASCYGHLDIISFLLRKGANVNAVDNYKSTPLVVTSDPQTVKLLVSFGADIHAKNVNSISAKSISLSHPYVCLAIEQGQKQLGERIATTKVYLGQIHRDFIEPRICVHWVKRTLRGLTQARSSNQSNVSLLGTIDTSAGIRGDVAAKKRKREDGSLIKREGVPQSVAQPANGPGQKRVKTINGTSTVKMEEDNDDVEKDPPRCIAELILSYLYPRD